MLPNIDPNLYYEMRSQELLREAGQHRLVREAMRGRSQNEGALSRILSALGDRLITWGAYLKNQANSPVQNVNPCPELEISTVNQRISS